jgi:hypothetical protein
MWQQYSPIILRFKITVCSEQADSKHNEEMLQTISIILILLGRPLGVSWFKW